MKSIAIDCFTNDQVKEINKVIKKNIVRKEDVSNVSSDSAKIGNFSIVNCAPLMGLLHPWLNTCKQINTEYFGYDVDCDFQMDTMNYNVYGINDEYGWHIDSENKFKYDMKLTCLLNLSEEPYEGGIFCLINGKEQPPLNSGTGLVFNSLIAHKVTPITKGERITLTYWASGSAWR